MSEQRNLKWTIRESAAPPPVRKVSIFEELWADLMLRLERTPAHKWLCVKAETTKDHKSIAAALTSRGSVSHGEVEVTVRLAELSTYVRRGPNWSKRNAGSLAHIAADPADSPNTNGNRKPGRKPKAEAADFD